MHSYETEQPIGDFSAYILKIHALQYKYRLICRVGTKMKTILVLLQAIMARSFGTADQLTSMMNKLHNMGKYQAGN